MKQEYPRAQVFAKAKIMERGLKEAQELLVSHARGLAGCINHAKVEKTLRKIGFWTRSIDVRDIKGLPDDPDKLGECVLGHETFVVLPDRTLLVLVKIGRASCRERVCQYG